MNMLAKIITKNRSIDNDERLEIYEPVPAILVHMALFRFEGSCESAKCKELKQP